MRSHLRNLLVPLLYMALTLAVFLGIYILVWGWDRFKADFLPLDSSRVGPNLCASLVLVVVLIAHNEFVVEKKAEERHESHRQCLLDAVEEIAHPTEEAETSIADQVEAQFRSDLLDRLNESTPGGLGTIASKLDVLVPPQPLMSVTKPVKKVRKVPAVKTAGPLKPTAARPVRK